MSDLIKEIRELQDRHTSLRKRVRAGLPDRLADELRELLAVTSALGWFNAINQAEQFALTHVDLGNGRTADETPKAQAMEDRREQAAKRAAGEFSG
jgi:hypothetical protein